jgi:hypothetical protein
MHAVLGGDLGERLVFGQHLLNDLRFEAGRVVTAVCTQEVTALLRASPFTLRRTRRMVLQSDIRPK